MAISYSAVIKFSSSKTCFLTVPASWISNNRSSQELAVCKIIYNEKNEAFVSCKLKSNHADSINAQVLLDGRFAEKLGIKENETVCVQLYDRNVRGAEKVFVEPLHQDYWEIMSLNSSVIGNSLLNQIRVLCKDQIFPIWVHESVVFAKVSAVTPDVHPALLEEFTEIHIIPISQSGVSNFTTQFKKRGKEKHLQYKHLRRNSKPTNSVTEDKSNADRTHNQYMFDAARKTDSSDSRFSLLRYMFDAVSGASSTSSNTIRSVEELETEEFEPLNFDASLRVIPYSKRGGHDDTLPIALQATTVFISSTTYTSVTGETNVPPCFVARLTKCLSPLEWKQKKQEVTPPQSDTIKLKSKVKKDGEIGHMIREEKDTFGSACVNVVVMQSADAEEYDVPKSLFYTNGLVVVPKELKRSLGLQVSSIVHCKSVRSKAIFLKNLVLHPVMTLHPHCDEENLSKAFKIWAEQSNLDNSSLLISDGTLVVIKITEIQKEFLFFASLQEASDNSANKSVSSFGSSCPSTPDSEKNVSFDSDPRFGYIDKDTLKTLNLRIGSQMTSMIRTIIPTLFKPQELYQEIPTLRLEALGGVKEMAENAMSDIEFWLKLRPLSYVSNHPSTFNGCLMLCGPKGIGKSTFAKALCKKLGMHPFYVYVSFVECLPLRGKRVESISKNWDAVLADAVHREPSIILFEDLDYIASCPATPEQSAGPDGLYFTSTAQTFMNFMRKVVESKKRIVIIVTSKSSHSLHPSLMNSKGRHVFQTVLEIEPPSVLQREEILQSLILSKLHIAKDTLKSVSLKDLALKTDGYFAKDLESLIDRAVHAAWSLNEPAISAKELDAIYLTEREFEEALKGYAPTSLRGIPLQLTEKKNWRDVGGLHAVKKIIQQIIMWPVKYKSLFKNYTLKPQSNILLYGVPGTGKTLLASVVANECGLNFISIKGPELLSKYIGASEQAIRDLFQKACSAKPCILFFDEFDSIAPRRGHDSTGVTDRVVNQLLTQLDGVESLEGVHVLAATSRPELIDPALLRPGRLDKCVLCPLPDEDERLEILKCLSCKLPLQDDVDFKPLISKTEHFSGADLQALLYSAHIEALHEIQNSRSRRLSTSSSDVSYSIDKSKLIYVPTLEEGICTPSAEEEKKIVQEVDVLLNHFQGANRRSLRSRHRHSTLTVSIDQQHLMKVVCGMKPSVSLQERLRYKTVFERFQHGIDKKSLDSIEQSMKRVTLA